MTNFGQGHLNGASVDGRSKKDRSHPSVMSPGRDGMSGRVATVKPRPEPPSQYPGGRFLGTYAHVPEVMTGEGGVPAPCTRFQHLVDRVVLLEQKRRSDTLGLLSPRRRIRNGSPQELVRPRYRLQEPEGDRVLGDLLRATSCGDEQLLTSQVIWGGVLQVTPDHLHMT